MPKGRKVPPPGDSTPNRPTREQLDMLSLNDNAEMIMHVGYNGYRTRGRGAVIIAELGEPAGDQQQLPSGVMRGLSEYRYLTKEDQEWPDRTTEHMVETYDPQRQIIVIFVRANGKSISAYKVRGVKPLSQFKPTTAA